MHECHKVGNIETEKNILLLVDVWWLLKIAHSFYKSKKKTNKKKKQKHKLVLKLIGKTKQTVSIWRPNRLNFAIGFIKMSSPNSSLIVV